MLVTWCSLWDTASHCTLYMAKKSGILSVLFSLLHASSSEDQSQGDLLHKRRHQDRSRNQEQNHLQAERCDRARPQEDGAVAEGWPAVPL